MEVKFPYEKLRNTTGRKKTPFGVLWTPGPQGLKAPRKIPLPSKKPPLVLLLGAEYKKGPKNREGGLYRNANGLELIHSLWQIY